MTAPTARSTLPIGVFDSGVGGLTVLGALERALPDERFVYLGDTARLPYGTKSPSTVVRYALQSAEALVGQGIKALVVACNTASAAALPALGERWPELPLVGVIEPGARAACAASRGGRIAVLATEGTVRGGAYQRAIAALRPAARTTAIACPLFVALAEEGWFDGTVAEAAAQRYLGAVMAGSQAPDTLVLGCTHFPVLRPVLAALVGPGVAIVDSAETTALAVRAELAARGLLARADGTAGASAAGAAPSRFLATDGAARFAAVGSRFLGRSLDEAKVELIDL